MLLLKLCIFLLLFERCLRIRRPPNGIRRVEEGNGGGIELNPLNPPGANNLYDNVDF